MTDAERDSAVPRRRIPADLSKQAPNNSYGGRLYYEELEFTCVDCGAAEVWTAEQQKWWYEVAKGSIYSVAKRCRACRAARRHAPRASPTDDDSIPEDLPGDAAGQ